MVNQLGRLEGLANRQSGRNWTAVGSGSLPENKGQGQALKGQHDASWAGLRIDGCLNARTDSPVPFTTSRGAGESTDRFTSSGIGAESSPSPGCLR